MPRGASAAVLVAGLFIAGCDRLDTTIHAREAGAIGTIGKTTRAGSVAGVLGADVPPEFVGRERDGIRLWDLTKQFYQKRGDAPAWIEDGRPRRQMNELLAALQSVDRDGLDPALYGAAALNARTVEAGHGLLGGSGLDEEESADLDVWMTYLYLQFASDLADGVAGPSHADPHWQIRSEPTDPLMLLERALEENRVGKSLEDLVPRHPQYIALRSALARYREIAGNGGWPTLPSQLKLKPGQDNAAVPLVAKRLAVTGDYTGSIDERNTIYGDELQEAVKHFQRRHGLEPDGVVGASAVAQMNVPVEERIGQIALNLERWRWLPRALGDRFVLVNIPEFRLEVWDHDRVPLAMRVIVGKKDTPTPIFTDDMTHLVFAPYWNVPADIVQKETVPTVLRDPEFLNRTNMEVLDKSGTPVDPSAIDLEHPAGYRFRQRPGASNSLGLVKFMFPNQFNVYLHDTPADSLFARAARSLSHGCVRLEEPAKLAQYVLADQPDWTPERIDEAMHAGHEHTVRLARPLRVYLGYWTARVSDDGLLQFRHDVYGIDARQTAVLKATTDRLKARATAAAARAGRLAQVARKG
jgi:L,D-transpeptidase YcbB